MDTAFTHLLAMLGGIADPRRAEGKLYGLPHVFLFSILAVMAGANFRDTEWAPFIAAVIRVHRRRLERDTATGLWNLASETSYHVSNAVFSAHAAGGAIRAHWGIENRHHYPRDVTMGEDACRVRKNPGILARIRSFAANIMRANNVANMTDARYRNAIGGLDRLFSYHTK